MLSLFVAAVLAVPTGDAPDAGSRLTAAECSALLDAMMSLSVTEVLAADPEVKAMSSELRMTASAMAKKQAVDHPRLKELKVACPARYSPKQRDCIMAAKSMREVDACSKN